MANLDLVGQIACEIDYAFSITCGRVSIRVSTPTVVKKGAFGPVGTARGIEDASAQLSFAVPKTGLEFDFDELSDRPGGFTFSYPLGSQKRALVGCRATEKSVSNDPGSGDTTYDVTLIATEDISL